MPETRSTATAETLDSLSARYSGLISRQQTLGELIQNQTAAIQRQAEEAARNSAAVERMMEILEQLLFPRPDKQTTEAQPPLLPNPDSPDIVVVESTAENVDEAAESGDDYDVDVHLHLGLKIDDVVDSTQSEVTPTQLSADNHTFPVIKTDEYDDLNDEIGSETSLGDLISCFNFRKSVVCENVSVNLSTMADAMLVKPYAKPPAKPPDNIYTLLLDDLSAWVMNMHDTYEEQSSLLSFPDRWKHTRSVHKFLQVKVVDGNCVYDKGKSDMYDKEWYGAVVEENLKVRREAVTHISLFAALNKYELLSYSLPNRIPSSLPPENDLKLDVLDDDVAELEQGVDSLFGSSARFQSHMLSVGQIAGLEVIRSMDEHTVILIEYEALLSCYHMRFLSCISNCLWLQFSRYKRCFSWFYKWNCVIICFEQFSDHGGNDLHSAWNQKFAHTANSLGIFAHQFVYLSYIDIGVQVKRRLLMEHFSLMRCAFHLEQRHCEADVVTTPILIFTLHGKPRNRNTSDVQNGNHKGGWALQVSDVSKAFGEMIMVGRLSEPYYGINDCFALKDGVVTLSRLDEAVTYEVKFLYEEARMLVMHPRWSLDQTVPKEDHDSLEVNTIADQSVVVDSVQTQVTFNHLSSEVSLDFVWHKFEVVEWKETQGFAKSVYAPSCYISICSPSVCLNVDMDWFSYCAMRTNVICNQSYILSQKKKVRFDKPPAKPPDDRTHLELKWMSLPAKPPDDFFICAPLDVKVWIEIATSYTNVHPEFCDMIFECLSFNMCGFDLKNSGGGSGLEDKNEPVCLKLVLYKGNEKEFAVKKIFLMILMKMKVIAKPPDVFLNILLVLGTRLLFKPRDIGFLLVTCSLFHTTPFLSHNALDKYEMSGRTKCTNHSGVVSSAVIKVSELVTDIVKVCMMNYGGAAHADTMQNSCGHTLVLMGAYGISNASSYDKQTPKVLCGMIYYLAEKGHSTFDLFLSWDGNNHSKHKTSTITNRFQKISYNTLAEDKVGRGAPTIHIAAPVIDWDYDYYVLDILLLIAKAMKDVANVLSASQYSTAHVKYLVTAISFGSFHARSHGLMLLCVRDRYPYGNSTNYSSSIQLFNGHEGEDEDSGFDSATGVYQLFFNSQIVAQFSNRVGLDIDDANEQRGPHLMMKFIEALITDNQTKVRIESHNKVIFKRNFARNLLTSIFTWRCEFLLFSLPRPPEIALFWLPLSFWFSSPRPPEFANLEDKVILKEAGMLHIQISISLGT